MTIDQLGITYFFNLSILEWIVCGQPFIYGIAFYFLVRKSYKYVACSSLIVSLFPMLAYISSSHGKFLTSPLEMILLAATPVLFVIIGVNIYKRRQGLGHKVTSFLFLALACLSSIWSLVDTIGLVLA
jgi:hypothetical protein